MDRLTDSFGSKSQDWLHIFFFDRLTENVLSLLFVLGECVFVVDIHIDGFSSLGWTQCLWHEQVPWSLNYFLVTFRRAFFVGSVVIKG